MNLGDLHYTAHLSGVRSISLASNFFSMPSHTTIFSKKSFKKLNLLEGLDVGDFDSDYTVILCL